MQRNQSTFNGQNNKVRAQWILVKDLPIDLESQENVPVYFDQFGALTRKLKIKHVPAKVVQEGQWLKVEEIPLRKL